ncbi:spore gernimation protein GerPC [Bacillus glycinifermentans]|uniref:Spore germination protein GerPC n=1 Tax=Bacillus glycinifermentans TaxID=1664069 RepID=A0A0J6E3U1_9BACI|nr:spore germination protein GerPC [Bacillus glycinifermentans]ATH95001.1 spore gernimation protein GerPC [Bacillus glycinifermentans]KMM57902.1 spore gernimation protein GerPC [Bacillus glycinifermentans]KRT93191.1 spore gernimation protein GerPC [Bacillus glycinifermentans]MEC0487633.1 spore germination protein GerPC [Bacillus glycinifermentans]MEC0495765.1 spore germination protein GerPC [Bacillus glycinifermentans]
MNQMNPSYSQNVYGVLQQQAAQIQQLERQMIAIQTELNRMKENPGTRIDRVEYKFDQLKIERLEGTLNIGLNPAEQEQIENFQIGQQPPEIGMLQKEMDGQLLQHARLLVDAYLNEEIPHHLEQLESRYDSKLDETNRHHIIEDIRKQIDSRLRYYAKHLKPGEFGNPREHAEKLAEHVKRDIIRAIEHFLQAIPDEMKGNEDE